MSDFSKMMSDQLNKDEDDEQQVFINDEKVFKAAMTKDFPKITQLVIFKEGITKIDSSNASLTQLASSLRKLDLSSNKIKCIEHLEVLVNLTDLNLSSNNISEIQNLQKLSKLATLKIDYNRITKIQSIKPLRKLEKLSLAGN